MIPRGFEYEKAQQKQSRDIPVASNVVRARCMPASSINTRLALSHCQIVPAIKHIRVERRTHLYTVPFVLQHMEPQILVEKWSCLWDQSSLRAHSCLARSPTAGIFIFQRRRPSCKVWALSFDDVRNVKDRFELSNIPWGFESFDYICCCMRCNLQAHWAGNVSWIVDAFDSFFATFDLVFPLHPVKPSAHFERYRFLHLRFKRSLKYRRNGMLPAAI